MNLDDLRRDGSWQFTDSRAAFRLRTSAPAGTDPERWESTLIDALLADPIADGFTELDLRLTDYHVSARRAAESLAARPRPALTTLRFGYDFKYLFELGTTSTGGRIDPLEHLHEGFVGDATDPLWAALPALRSLTLEGGLLVDRIASDTLTELVLRGAVFSDGAVFPDSPLPALTSLRLENGTDVHGVACPVLQLEELSADSLPNLRTLDLSEAEFDESDGTVLEILAESPILARLDELRVRTGDEDATLPPRFAHVRLTVDYCL